MLDLSTGQVQSNKVMLSQFGSNRDISKTVKRLQPWIVKEYGDVEGLGLSTWTTDRFSEFPGYHDEPIEG